MDELLTQGKHEDIIAVIEQSIILGKARPWMYEVLAVSMESAGRPKSQIERVLLSSQDFIAGDARSMMVLAANMTRLERFERAIELYRQAANLEPHRPEPFLLALKLARRIRNHDAIAWTAPEVAAFSWGKDRELDRRSAEEAAADAISAMTNSGQITKAIQLQEAMRRAQETDLVVRLDWNGQGDLDLSVEEPFGTVCASHKPQTIAGGIFVHDGHGPNQARCYDEYVAPLAMSGDYKVRVHHVWGEIVGKRARLTIIRGKGTAHETTETHTVMLGPTDGIVRFSLMNGRRETAEAHVPERKPHPTERMVSGQQAILAQLGGGGGIAAGGQRPFATGNVGYQPVIQWISEGVSLNALATVSGDRRYVRLSMSPNFSTITDVFTFTFLSN